MAEIQPIVFRILNFVAAAFMIIGGIAFIIVGGFPSFILAIYSILFGIMTGLFEFNLPKSITSLASFMFSFLGRSIFYIFLGCIILNYNTLSLACGIIVILIGVTYCICHFLPHINPPQNMASLAFEKSLGMNDHNGSVTLGKGTSTPILPMSSLQQETTPYPQKTYIPNETHII